MSKSNDTGLKTLFTDAAKELVEKAKLRCKINKLLDIMIADKERLKNAYAEVGRLYLEEALEENASRVEVLSGLINHLKDRIKRGEAKYKELLSEYEGSEGTDALKEELSLKIKKAKENTSVFAKNLSDKAKTKTDEIKEKLNFKKEKAVISADNTEFLELLEEELKADEETLPSAEKTMEKINALLESLEEDEMESDAPKETADTPEEVTKVVESIVEEATAEITKEENSEKMDEIAEDFTF